MVITESPVLPGEEMIPEGWKVVRLGDLESEGKLRFRTGFAQGAYNIAGNGVPQLRPFNVTERGTIDLSEVKFVQEPAPGSTYWVKPQDIIFNNTNSQELVGKTALFGIEGKFVLSNHMTFIRCDERQIDSAWLSWMLFHLWSQGLFAAICRRYVNQANVGLARLRGVSVLLPPLDEQRTIAGVLSTIQRAIEATDKVIAATRKLKASLMRHLFTYGPVPVTEADTVELQETEIGTIPAHWDIAPLADVVRRTSQIDPKRRPNWAFRYVDVSSVDNVRLQIINSTPLDSSVAPSRARKLIETNDVIFATVRPYLRRIALVPSELNGQICSTAFCVIRADPKRADSTYIYFAVSDQAFVERVAAHQHGTGYPAVTDSVVLQEAIPLPPLEDQVLVSKTLRSVDSKVETELKRKAALELAFNAALQALMTGNLRVLDSGSDDGTVQ